MPRPPLPILVFAPLLLLTSAVGASDDPVWEALGPDGGWVVDFAVVTDEPAVVYAAVGVSGLHQTLDGGETWMPANVGLEEHGQPARLGAVAVDRSTLPPTLLAGAGGRFGTSVRGIFRSTDGAQTWTTANQGLANEDDLLPTIEEIVFDPQSPSTVWAATSGGIFRSVDGGMSWARMDGGLGPDRWSALAVAPTNPDTVWIAAGGSVQGVWRSVDGGTSWQLRTTGLPDSPQPRVLAVDPTTPDRVLLGTRDGVWETTDGGGSWVRAGLESAPYVHDLALDPGAPATIWTISSRQPFVDFSVHRTTDGGKTWEELSAPEGRPEAIRWVGGTLWICGEGGLFESEDDGATWESRTGDLRGEVVTQVAVDPRTASTLYALSSSGRLRRTDDGGASWTDLTELNDTAFAHFGISPSNPDVLWGITSEPYYGVARSGDRGTTWTDPVLDPMDFGVLRGELLLQIHPHPQDSEHVWVGAFWQSSFQNFPGNPVGGLFESTDGGATWTRRYTLNDPETSLSFPASLAFDPARPERIYAGVTSSDPGGALRDGFVLVSADAGATWERSLEGTAFPQLAVDAAGDVYVGSSANGNPGYFVSRDAGATWQTISKGLPEDHANSGLVAHPTLPGVLYASTGTAMYFTLDGGGLWRPFGVDPDPERPTLRLPVLQVREAGHLSLVTGSDRAVLRLPRISCVPGMPGCADGGRFDVEVSWRDFSGNTGTAEPVPFATPDSGLYTFFSPDNWEFMVKVIDGCQVNGFRWVFAAASTNVEYTLRVTDRETGQVAEYENPLGNAAPAITDAEAFSCDEDRVGTPSRPAPWTATKLSIPPPSPAPLALASRVSDLPPSQEFPDPRVCRENQTERCLLGGRFRVSIEWGDFEGGFGTGRVVPFGSSDSGMFWFFSPENWEVLIKLLDGCSINDRHWVFAAATTNVAYTITVEDTVTGAVKEYENPLGKAADAVTDTDAFTCP